LAATKLTFRDAGRIVPIRPVVGVAPSGITDIATQIRAAARPAIEAADQRIKRVMDVLRDG
jgi:hypothetical protein